MRPPSAQRVAKGICAMPCPFQETFKGPQHHLPYLLHAVDAVDGWFELAEVGQTEDEPAHVPCIPRLPEEGREGQHIQ